MASRLLQQFLALIKKNAIIQFRSWKELLIMCLLPSLFMMAFAIIRATVAKPKELKEEYNNPVAPNFPISCYQGYGDLLYSPKSTSRKDVDKAIEHLVQRSCGPLGCGTSYYCPTDSGLQLVNLTEIKTIGFTSAKELEDYVVNNYDSVWAAISFVPFDEFDMLLSFRDQVHYRIRMKGTNLPDTSTVKQDLETGPTNTGFKYMYYGFTSLQTSIDEAIVSVKAGNSIPIMNSFQRFPYPQYKNADFYAYIGGSLSFYICLGFLLFVVKLISRLVSEKEKKIKETMKIMGLSDTVFWLSWFSYAFIVMFITMLILSFVFKVGKVFDKSDFGLIFIFFLLWGVSIICFCFLISVFFNKSKVASSLGAVILFVALLPNISVTNSSPPGRQFAACLLSPTCLSFGLERFSDYEKAGIGVTRSNMYDGTFNFGSVLTMLLIDIGIYSFLAWYLDQVLPREYGIRRKWYFLLQPSYWGLFEKNNGTVVPISQGADPADDNPTSEPVPPELHSKLSVEIRKMKKEFPVGSGKSKKMKTAVDDLNLCMYEGQILSLLGHNGAGKTTTVSMLTGFFPPSKGDAMIYGMSINNKMERIRENIGLCSQYNVLWDELTVEEHLYLFAALKGVPNSEIDAHVKERIRDVGLEEKTHSLSKDLSGGQKRKLCVAIAFTGGTKIIFLDEPTSGMDPFSRRAIWALLQRLKENRTIVLTTHFMDEADLLGDRIAIMNHGRLAACGSSLFLKSRFGVGYTFTVVKKPSCQEQQVSKFLRQYAPDTRLLSNVGAELSYVIPLSSASTFGQLFSKFEGEKDTLGVDSYGISVTTLEEVFLRIANSAAVEAPQQSDQNTTKNHAVIQVNDLDERIRNAKAQIYDPTLTYTRSAFRQFKALLMKRLLVSRRDSKALFQMLFYPSLFILLAVVASKNGGNGRNNKLYPLYYDKMSSSGNIFVSSQSQSNGVYDDLSKQLKPTGSTGWFSHARVTPVNMNPFCQQCYMLTCQVRSVSNKLSGKITNQELLNKYESCLLKRENVTISSCPSFDLGKCNGLRSGVTFLGSALVNYKVLYDSTYFHSLPTAINYVNNAIARKYLGSKSSIIAENLPLPDPSFVGQDYGLSFSLSLYIGIALCIIPGALITSLMKEREVKAAHQQLVCGVDSKMLWATYLIADFMLYMLAIILFFLIFFATSTKAFIGSNFIATLILFIFYGLAVFPYTYCISFYLKSSTSAQSRITSGFISISLAALIIISVLYALPSTTNSAKPVDYIFTLFPTYAVSIGVFYISLNDLARTIPGQTVKEPMSWDVAGRPITFLILEAVFFTILVNLLQSGIIEAWIYEQFSAKKSQSNSDNSAEGEVAEDIDVQNERTRIESASDTQESIVVKNLRKVYYSSQETKVAVKNLTFGIPEGECFGLLGPNGAGKTTTLSMLSGDITPTTGEVLLKGINMNQNKLDAFKLISLCPQVDPLLDLMTGREHLMLFGTLKGIPEDRLPGVVTNTLEMLGLAEHAEKMSSTYSGGNKRKLSLGIALLGDPKVIFLDEPSTGMDPGARRFMWDVISNFLPGRSIILTTHSMEECEALCSRIGIVVNGYLKCVGSPQHLKNRFGGGYRLDLQCAWSSVDKVKEYIHEIFPTSVLLEWHGGKLRYEIPRTDLNLGRVFDDLERNRASLRIMDYALSQTTLEQVFINFARTQQDDQQS